VPPTPTPPGPHDATPKHSKPPIVKAIKPDKTTKPDKPDKTTKPDKGTGSGSAHILIETDI
jgi:hypothetical protein